MNIPKIIEALEQTDQLCMGLLDKDTKRGCAISQLFFAAGKSYTEIAKEIHHALHLNSFNYVDMFDGLLRKEYDMNEEETDIIWRANDSFKGSPKARHVRMVEEFKAFVKNDVEESVWVDEEVEELQPTLVGEGR